MDNTFKPPSLLSICTGMRGLEKGVARAIAALRGYRGDQEWEERDIIQPAVYVEIESVIAYNLAAQMEQRVLAPVPIWTDLKTFPWAAFHRKICLLTGGYPCQPFSTAGKQFGILDPRHLFPYIEQGIPAVGPVCCFFENVANHLNIGYREVRHSLETLGYQVEEEIFSAEEVGAPHLRKRLFILAVANPYCTEQSKRRGDLAKMLGLPEGQRQPKHRAAVSGGNGQTVVNPAGICKREPTDKANAISTQRGAWNESVNRSSLLGHSFGPGLAIGEVQPTWQERETAERAGTTLWPAGQGEYQHPWEHPRIESRLGFTVDGYDFTEDLLRMAGNAVVEQQAELAFRTLIQRFL